MKLAIVTNADWFFLSHRLPIALAAIKRGDDVWLLSKDTGRRNEIEAHGIHFIDIPFDRSGTNPIHEMRCVWRLLQAYRHIHPDVIHHVTIKAALLGSTAAKLGGFPHVVNAISGMGYAFTNGRKGLLQSVMKTVMNYAFRKRTFAFILQNPEDQAEVRRQHFVPDRQVYLIKGSGVDLDEYHYTPPVSKDKIEVLFPARILKDKGILELIQAARRLQSQYEGRIRFVLAGDCDEGNPSVLHEAELRTMLIPGYLEWIGYQKQMRPIYEHCDIVCFPSYREGLPKSLIEACAVGRPIITTDVPGCRECVINGYNGFLVPEKDVLPIQNRLIDLIEDETLRTTFGKHSREFAEKEFSIKLVVQRHLDIYDSLLNHLS